jgi:hypothetical protein
MQHHAFSANRLDGPTDSPEEMLRGDEKLNRDNMVAPSTEPSGDGICEERETSQSPTVIIAFERHEKPFTLGPNGRETSVLKYMDDLMRSDL